MGVQQKLMRHAHISTTMDQCFSNREAKSQSTNPVNRYRSLTH
jgi:hypothetical protein